MNFDKLEVGPPIDRLVAEHVFGFTVVPECRFMQDHDTGELMGWAEYEPNEADSLDAAEIAQWRESYSIIQDGIPLKRPDGSIWGCEPVPQYSTDIADAWKIIEKINDRMWSLYWLPDAKIWQASFVDVSPVMTCEAPTAPLAICFAALVVP